MIELDEITFRYGEQTILSGASHAFQPGATTALVGRSGAGKSTLLYLIGLLLTPQSGRVAVGGEVTAHLTDGQRSALRAERFGFIFQDALLDLARTVLDNVVQGVLYKADRGVDPTAEARDLLTQFEVPVSSWDRRPGQVSGGQAQRVSLCRALMGSPGVILADEPTGNLDPVTATVVWDALRDAAAKGATVIVATHDPARAATCDHLVEVRDGLLR
jgi:ABC-type lipoprotein export system ATPase subunit